MTRLLRVVVTGANGFAGRAICAELARRGHKIVGTVRDQQSARGVRCDEVVVSGPLEVDSDMTPAFRGADAVVHTANWSGATGRGTGPEYAEAVNVKATARLGQQAARCGVGQFVFLSSIKAIGSRTDGLREPFTLQTEPAPTDHYGRSKLAAERALLSTNAMTTSIIRPPVLYGPGVKGGVLRLFQLASRQVPLPLAMVTNSRDLLSVQSLADMVGHCIDQPGYSSRILLARDGEALSSAMLYARIASSLGTQARIFPMPPRLLRLAAAVSGRGALADSLLSSLEIDDSETRSELGWEPVCGMQEALSETARWYLAGGGA